MADRFEVFCDMDALSKARKIRTEHPHGKPWALLDRDTNVVRFFLAEAAAYKHRRNFYRILEIEAKAPRPSPNHPAS